MVDARVDVATVDATDSRAGADADSAAFTADPTDPSGGFSRRAGGDVSAGMAGASTAVLEGAVAVVSGGVGVADARSKFAPNIA